MVLESPGNLLKLSNNKVFSKAAEHSLLELLFCTS